MRKYYRFCYYLSYPALDYAEDRVPNDLSRSHNRLNIELHLGHRLESHPYPVAWGWLDLNDNMTFKPFQDYAQYQVDLSRFKTAR